jgi:hypothetical protein
MRVTENLSTIYLEVNSSMELGMGKAFACKDQNFGSPTNLDILKVVPGTIYSL